MNVVGQGHDHLASQEVDQDPEKKAISLLHLLFIAVRENQSIMFHLLFD